VVAPLEPGVAAPLLGALPGFRWLDEAQEWFSIDRSQPSRFGQRARRILSVTGPLSARELRSCLRRADRRSGTVPPATVLLEVCRSIPGLRVDGDTVAANPPLDWDQALRGESLEVVRIFREHGPLLTCIELEEHRVRVGIPRTTFYQYLSRLPAVRRYAVGLYGLRGDEITPGMIEAARERNRRAEKRRSEFRWLADGRLELVSVLSLGAVCSGAITIPPRLSRQVQGRFDYRAEDGQKGTLTIRQYFLWGLSRVFRRQGVDAGDRLRIAFDLVGRRASFTLDRTTRAVLEGGRMGDRKV
jgi:hypothetical protein